jgi:hypothetical protein
MIFSKCELNEVVVEVALEAKRLILTRIFPPQAPGFSRGDKVGGFG